MGELCSLELERMGPPVCSSGPVVAPRAAAVAAAAYVAVADAVNRDAAVTVVIGADGNASHCERVKGHEL